MINAPKVPDGNKSTINVLLAGSNAESRSAWQALLREINSVDLIGSRSTGLQTINDYDHLKVDILIVDAVMDDMTGFETGRFIKEQNKHVRVLLVSPIHNDMFRYYSEALDLDAYLSQIPDPLFMELLLKDLMNGRRCFDLKALLKDAGGDGRWLSGDGSRVT